MAIRIAIGGDVSFSKHKGQIAGLIVREKGPIPIRLWRKLTKYLNSHSKGEYSPTIKIKKILLEEYGSFWKNPYKEIDDFEDINIPFEKLGNFFKKTDIGYVNLETPLCSDGRHIGAFCSSPEYIHALRENNIKIVSIANNHSFDAGERGFIETINILKKNNIKYFGGGLNIEEARGGEIIEVKGVKLGFLGYTSICNSFFISLAKNNQPGILPLFEPIVLNDIRSLKKKCDFLVVAPHFDIENVSKIHRNSIDIAHKMVDCGADLIIGSHAHVPKPIETYNGKLIIYCLGNLIFLQKTWGNSLVAQVTLSDSGKYENVEFYPINTKDMNCSSPYIMENQEGDRLLHNIKKESELIFKTPLVLDKHILKIHTF